MLSNLPTISRLQLEEPPSEHLINASIRLYSILVGGGSTIQVSVYTVTAGGIVVKSQGCQAI